MKQQGQPFKPHLESGQTADAIESLRVCSDGIGYGQRKVACRVGAQNRPVGSGQIGRVLNPICEACQRIPSQSDGVVGDFGHAPEGRRRNRPYIDVVETQMPVVVPESKLEKCIGSCSRDNEVQIGPANYRHINLIKAVASIPLN